VERLAEFGFEQICAGTRRPGCTGEILTIFMYVQKFNDCILKWQVAGLDENLSMAQCELLCVARMYMHTCMHACIWVAELAENLLVGQKNDRALCVCNTCI
jgi:hypothetical protein